MNESSCFTVLIVALTLLAADGVSAQHTDAAPEPAQVVVTADDRGFRIASSSDHPRFELALQALVQADARKFVDSSDLTQDVFVLRRMRPRLSGTIFGLINYKLVTDFGAGDVVLTDASLELHPYPWLRLVLGKFQPPLGAERLQSDATLPMIETAPDANLAVSRDVGAMLWGELLDKLLVYQVAITNGAPDGTKQDLDIGGHKDVTARLLAQPFASHAELGVLGVGFAASAGLRDGTPKTPSLSSYKSAGQLRYFGYLQSDANPAGTAFAQGWHTRLNPHAYYYRGALGLLAELIQSRQDIHLSDRAATITQRGWHLTVSYVFGGTNAYEGSMPLETWDPSAGHFGGLELAARYGRLDMDSRTFPAFSDPSKAAHAAMSAGITASWLFGRTFRAVLALERTQFAGGAGTALALADRPTEYVLITRTTLNL